MKTIRMLLIWKNAECLMPYKIKKKQKKILKSEDLDDKFNWIILFKLCQIK